MTYPPASSGYPPAQQPSGAYGSSAPAAAPAAPATPAEETPSKLPMYLLIAVAGLGLAAYLGGFGPGQTLEGASGGPSLSHAAQGMATTAALLAALLAGVGVLPKAKTYTPVVAVIAVAGLLLTIADLFGGTSGNDAYETSIGWGLWLVLVFTLLQAVAAVGALLLESGVITAPAPKPAYDPYAQYGLPPGGYYGQGGAQQGGYQSYGSYSSTPSTGGFGAPQGQQAPAAQAGPSAGGFNASQATQQIQSVQQPPTSTPPTGFPSYGQPPAAGQAPGGGSAAPGQQYGGQQSPSGPQQL